ncbi:hypothetical protein PTKIN_Ptkin06aG0060500 [Pterospermum kingtungense]
MLDKSVFKGLPSVQAMTATELEKYPSEWESYLQPSDENEAAQDRLLLSPNHEKNKQLTAEGRKKRKLQSAVTGEEKEDRLEKHIKTKTVLEVTKILKDRVQRRKTKERDNEGLHKALIKLYPEIASSLLNIQKNWAPLSDLQNINEEIKKIEQEVKVADIGNMKARQEMKPRLLGLGEMIERFDVERKKYSGKVRSIQDCFIEGASVKTMREKLSSAFPDIAQEEIARSTANQDQESLQTCEQLQNSLKCSSENFAQHNKEVGDAFPYAQDAGATPTIFDQGTPVGGECDPPQGFPAHNDVPEKETPIPMYGTALATASTGTFASQEADTRFAPNHSYDYATFPRPKPDDPSFPSNAKYGVRALVSTVPVADRDYMKTVPCEILENLLACPDQMRNWIVGLLKNARLEVLETAMAEANSAKGSEELAQNKEKMLENEEKKLEIELTVERQKVELFRKLMEDETRAANLKTTALMTRLNHVRDLKKRLKASGASSSKAPPTGYFRASGSIPLPDP